MTIKKSSDEVPNKEVPNKEVPNKEVPSKEVPSKEVPSKEVPSIATLDDIIISNLDKIEESSRYGVSADIAFTMLKGLITVKDISVSNIVIPDVDCTIATLSKKIKESSLVSEDKIQQAISEASSVSSDIDYI